MITERRLKWFGQLLASRYTNSVFFHAQQGLIAVFQDGKYTPQVEQLDHLNREHLFDAIDWL